MLLRRAAVATSLATNRAPYRQAHVGTSPIVGVGPYFYECVTSEETPYTATAIGPASPCTGPRAREIQVSAMRLRYPMKAAAITNKMVSVYMLNPATYSDTCVRLHVES